MGRRGLRLASGLAVAALGLAACRGDTNAAKLSSTTRAPTTSATQTPIVEGQVVVAVGDVVCSPQQQAANAKTASACRSEDTAAVAKSLSPDAVLLAGDIQYDRGTEAEFASAYAASGWASLKSITYPAPGNHEYATRNAAAYFATFGGAAGPDGRGWYSVDIGEWHVIALNSNCKPAGGCGVGSPQESWLRADLAAASAAGRVCTLAFWHHPRWSSGFHGSDDGVEPLWAALADAHAEIVISGHDHHYERFAPQRGVRQFVVGTGGRSLYPVFGTERGSQVVNSATFGVLELHLAAGAYSWRFVPVSGATFSDAGTGTCQ